MIMMILVHLSSPSQFIYTQNKVDKVLTLQATALGLIFDTAYGPLSITKAQLTTSPSPQIHIKEIAMDI